MSGTSDDSSAWGSDDGSKPEESLDGSLDSDDDDEAFTHTTVAPLEQRAHTLGLHPFSLSQSCVERYMKLCALV